MDNFGIALNNYGHLNHLPKAFLLSIRLLDSAFDHEL